MSISFFNLALAAVALVTTMPVSAQSTHANPDFDYYFDRNSSNQCQLTKDETNQSPSSTSHRVMFSNMDLTPQQKEILSTLENPFEEDFVSVSTDKTRAATFPVKMPDRCGGDPRFQSSDEVFDLVLQERHQQLVDARVEYLQTLSEVLTPEQYEQFIQNLDSRGRVD